MEKQTAIEIVKAVIEKNKGCKGAAIELKMSTSAIYRLRDGKSNPRADTIDALLKLSLIHI